METRSKIVDLTRHSPGDAEARADPIEQSQAQTDESHLFTEPVDYSADFAGSEYYDDEAAVSRRWTALVVPTLLGLALVGWSAFFGWTYLGEVQAGIGAERVVALIGQWSMPSLLLGVAWLLFMRSSRAEADRFGDAATLLRVESEALERRMRTVNEEIALARQFLAENARELESVGRQAARALTDSAQELGQALADSDEKLKTLEIVSNAATTNMEQLRKHLPVVTSAAKDVTNQIGSAGNSAQLQVKSLIAALERVGEAGKATREYIDNMEVRAAEASDQMANKIGSSAASLTEATGAAEIRTTEMVALMSTAAEKLNESVSTASTEVDRVVTESGNELSRQLVALRSAMVELADQSKAEDARVTAILARISAHIDESADRMAEVGSAATDQTAKLAFAVSALGESTKEVGVALKSNDETTDRLLSSSEKLLGALASANHEIEHSLPAAIDRLDGRFAQNLAQIALASSNADALDRHGDNMLAKLTTLEQLIETQRSSAEQLMQESDAHFAARHEQADALAAALQQTRSLLEDMTDTANDKLVAALLRVRETTKQAAESSRKILDEELADVADRLSEQNKAALSAAVDGQIAELNGMIQGAIERNFAMSETATRTIATQLAELDEMTSSIEQRIAETRNSFDGVDDDSFARRMVLLTESLNSTAIDVAKIMSNEVTDTAWAAYLKGDRGIFTRRAVRLLDAGEARAIADHYGDDSEFREHVNRYIHDFESMMRLLLSTRDGHAIGVTLLSSDVGKLYVALAQAIERLRN